MYVFKERNRLDSYHGVGDCGRDGRERERPNECKE